VRTSIRIIAASILTPTATLSRSEASERAAFAAPMSRRIHENGITNAFLPVPGEGTRRGHIVSALILLSGFFFSTSGNAIDSSETEIEQGREIYGELCVTCHGRDMISPGGLTFDLRKFPKEQFERFRDAVLNGKPPTMPPWRDKVTDEDIKLLWVYVRSGG
jgi:mono/diheme cytochrome c family protein